MFLPQELFLKNSMDNLLLAWWFLFRECTPALHFCAKTCIECLNSITACSSTVSSCYPRVLLIRLSWGNEFALQHIWKHDRMVQSSAGHSWRGVCTCRKIVSRVGNFKITWDITHQNVSILFYGQ